MSKYIKKESKKYTFYSTNKLDKNLYKFIILNKNINDFFSNNILLSNKKFEVIIEKHQNITGRNLLKHIRTNLPYFINKAYVEKGVWESQNNDYLFIVTYAKQIKIAIILGTDKKIYIKSFYGIAKTSDKVKTWNKKHKHYTKKQIDAIIEYLNK